MGEFICPHAADLADVEIGRTIVVVDALGVNSSPGIQRNQLMREFKASSQITAAEKCSACGVTDNFEGERTLEECPNSGRIARRATIRFFINSF